MTETKSCLYSGFAKVAIIAGHGGTTNRGVVEGDLIESDITLRIAKELTATSLALPIAPYLIRQDNKVIDLPTRGSMASELGCDLVICIHVDKGPTPDWHGATCFYWPDVEDNTSRRVARRIATAMPPELRTMRVNSALDPNYPRVENVLKHHNRSATVVLVECGYASNENDNKFILSPYGRADIVSAINSGIIHYLRLKKP